jgi:HipA-like C-terminal domain
MFKEQSQFYKPVATEQKPNEAVDITSWYLGSPKTYPEGSREKKEVVCPTSDNHQFLIKGHQYLFKKPMVKEESGYTFYWQLWNEIIAYRLGRIINVEVPPAFASYRVLDNGEIEYGALIEWFYRYPKSGVIFSQILQGGSLMSKVIVGFDRGKGKQHNFQSITQALAGLNLSQQIQDRLIAEFFKILIFDAVIGNTDRHQENWEIVSNVKGAFIYTNFSPAFDNGTSLAYEIMEENILNRMNGLESYCNKGKQHMKWEMDSQKISHFEFLKLLLVKYPVLRPILENIANTDINPIFDEVDNLTRFVIRNEKYKLSENRAKLIKGIIKLRFDKLKELNAAAN